MDTQLNKQGNSRLRLVVIVAILAALALVAIPFIRDAVERHRAAQAVAFLQNIRTAQERYHSMHYIFCESISNLSLTVAAPRHFAIPDGITPSATIGSSGEASLESGWKVTATRQAGPSRYGAYTITFYESGFTNDGPSSVAERPRINPLKKNR